MNLITMDKILETSPALSEQMDSVHTVHACLHEINTTVRKSPHAAKHFMDNYRIVLSSAQSSMKKSKKKGEER